MASAGAVGDYPLRDPRGEFWASNPWHAFWQYLLAPGLDGSEVWLCARAGRRDGITYQPIPLADALAGAAPADWQLADWEMQPPRFNRFRLDPGGRHGPEHSGVALPGRCDCGTPPTGRAR